MDLCRWPFLFNHSHHDNWYNQTKYENCKVTIRNDIFFFQVMVILLQRLLGQKSLQYFTQFWAYLLQYCVGLILEMLWQMPSDFAIGEYVVTFVQKNPKRRKNVIWVEEEVVRKWWCFYEKINAEKSLAIHVLRELFFVPTFEFWINATAC